MIDGAQIIDFHGHPGRWGNGVAIPENVIPAMDAGGVDRSVLFNIWHPEGTTGNSDTAELVATNPDRFIGFAFVSPVMPERMVPELERAIDQLGFLGIKLYPPFTNINLNEPAWFPIYEFANERRLPLIWHTGIEAEAMPCYVAEVAKRFPRANFICGHSGNCPPMRRMAIDAARECENVFLETCSTFRTPGAIEQLVDEAGADRVLFGSDLPLMDPRSQIGKIITADIDDAAKRLVLGGNAARLLFGANASADA
jgi:predicted TIM-barrel fold metal-dependent hydrolase